MPDEDWGRSTASDPSIREESPNLISVRWVVWTAKSGINRRSSALPRGSNFELRSRCQIGLLLIDHIIKEQPSGRFLMSRGSSLQFAGLTCESIPYFDHVTSQDVSAYGTRL